MKKNEGFRWSVPTKGRMNGFPTPGGGGPNKASSKTPSTVGVEIGCVGGEKKRHPQRKKNSCGG